jgi:hypothetical protein
MSKESQNTEIIKNKALHIGGVMPHFFPDNQLFLKQAEGSRILTLKARELKHREVIIMCEENWESDDPNFGSPEYSEAGYFLRENEIDELISKLKEAKRFLNGA